MLKIEKNVVESFRLAKTDIIKTQEELIEISRTQKQMMDLMNRLKTNQLLLQTKVKEIKQNKAGKAKDNRAVNKAVNNVVHRATVVYVAPKNGKSFHRINCPFAQNIKPKNKLTFKSKVKALNEGFKPCRCIK